MKLKVLIIIFNAVLLTIFFTVFSFSFFTAGTEFIGSFLKNYWLFILFFFCFLTVINIFFINNWKLITALEAEDWTALSAYLEAEIFEKKHVTRKKVRILCEISILLGDFELLKRLEYLLEEQKPRYIRKFATRFAAAKLIEGDYQELNNFTSRLSIFPNISPWIYFYNAFSLQMLKQYPESAAKFSLLMKTKKEPLICLISSYLLASGLCHYLSIAKEEACKHIEQEKEKLKHHSLQYWKQYTSKEKQTIHILVLTKVIDEALVWLFQDDEEHAMCLP
ncbi:hypothetical protein [Treponema sp.]|uniref:hypothetical protein n=1 Tax=Treponema sp. TaxID=166 RepID=UPI003FA2C209